MVTKLKNISKQVEESKKLTGIWIVIFCLSLLFFWVGAIGTNYTKFLGAYMSLLAFVVGCLSAFILVPGMTSPGKKVPRHIDILVALCWIIGFCTFMNVGNLLLQINSGYDYARYTAIAMVSICCMAYVICLLIRMFRKNQIHKENFLCYMIVKFVCDRITGRAYYQKGFADCEQRRFCFTLILATALLMLSILVALVSGDVMFPLMICVLLGLFLILLYYVGIKNILKEYEALEISLKKMSEGEFENLPSYEETVFYPESIKIKKISERIQESVEKQIQAERMKIDLITNVSHDLKTPLTSVMNYIDLLSKEEMTPVCSDYITILKTKSDRLNKMVQNVFELAKVTSGNLEAKKEEVDMKKLLVQTLTDMEDAIAKAPVKIVEKLTEKPVLVESDGEKLYRVLQNVIGNALQYAMPETRVFITLEENDTNVKVTIKNVSAYEIDFSEEEILGRFVRGDKSRSTKGSGLGLPIAKEYTELCGGVFNLKIDGDVFFVELSFALRK